MDGLQPEREDAIATLGRRVEFLDHLTSPREKRALVDELGYSRSTVDRAIRELEYVGFVGRTDSGYVATAAGRLNAAAYRDFEASVAGVAAARDALEPLPNAAPVAAALFADAEVEVLEERPARSPLLGPGDDPPDEVAGVVAAAAGPAVLEAFATGVTEGLGSLSLVVQERLLEVAAVRHTDAVRSLVAHGDCEVRSGATPEFSLAVVTRGETEQAVLVVYGAEETVHATVRSEAEAAVVWARETVREHATAAADEASALVDWDHGPGVTAVSDRQRLQTQGFVTLTPAYFRRREPASLGTGLRTGLDLAEVAAGYAVDRESTGDGSPENLTDELVAGLRDGVDQVLVGPPGSGKSTVCKTVACRWYDAGHGPVYYRESGGSESFATPSLLEAELVEAEGHALVVVEDAVREEASEVFRVMKAVSGAEEVTFLLDARESEWEQPPGLPIDAGLAAYRTQSVERVELPPVTAETVDRLLDLVSRVTGTAVEVDGSQFLRETVADDAPESQGADDMLLVLHRLSLYVDPLGGYGSRTPTTLVEDVRQTLASLTEAGRAALDVGTLVNLLNVAGVSVTREAVYSLLAHHDLAAVESALSTLEGRAVFSGSGDRSAFRTVHESWSAQFLTELVSEEGERLASSRVGRCVSALLSLADDAALRDRLEAELSGEASLTARVGADPGGWADETAAKLFAVGLERPGLAVLFGTAASETIALPEACSEATVVQCAARRGRMALFAGRLDRAETELEAAIERAADTDGEAGARLVARCYNNLGTVANERGDHETAADRYREALERYEAIGHEVGVAKCFTNLGTLAHVRGDLDEAERLYLKGLDVGTDESAGKTRANTLVNLGVLAKTRGDPSLAEERYHRALELYREVGRPKDEADVLVNLGSVALFRSDLDAAAEYSKRCLDRYRNLGLPGGEAHGLNHLGKVARLRGHLEEASTYLERSLDRYAEVEDRRNAADARETLADVARLRGDFEEARAEYERCLECYRELGARQGEADARDGLAEVAFDRGDLDVARGHATESLSIDRDVGNARGKAASLRILGRISRERGAFDAARIYLRSARSISREAADGFGEARAVSALGETASRAGEFETARDRFAAAAARHEELGSIHEALSQYARLADIEEALGEDAAATDHRDHARALAADTGLEAIVSDNERPDHL